MKESKIKNGLLAATVVLVFGFSAVSMADGGTEMIGKSEKVAFGDLNVKKQGDARRLYQRLRRASKRVCGVESLVVAGSLDAVRQAKECFRETLESAVAEVDDPMLTRIHQS